MRKIVFAVASVMLLVGCKTNPFSGKSTLALVSDDALFPSSFQQYGDFLKENKVIRGTTDAKRIEDVGNKIRIAAEKWLTANGHPDYLANYKWEYNLIDSKDVNAWCMPGGKIVFYTGILPVCKTDAGIATVMGHEVSHALANHGQQRMSNAMLQQAVGTGLSAATANSKEGTKQALAMAYGLGTEYGIMLPFSRSNESEADKIGLTLMAIAGYNPDEAVAFWERMAANSSGAGVATFMSTHPSNEQRIADLKKLIPEAKAEAAKFGVVYK